MDPLDEMLQVTEESTFCPHSHGSRQSSYPHGLRSGATLACRIPHAQLMSRPIQSSTTVALRTSEGANRPPHRRNAGARGRLASQAKLEDAVVFPGWQKPRAGSE